MMFGVSNASRWLLGFSYLTTGPKLCSFPGQKACMPWEGRKQVLYLPTSLLSSGAVPFDIGSSEIHWAHCSQAAGISADINGGSCRQPPVWRWKGRNPSCKWVSVLGLCSGKLHECLNWKGAWFYTIMNTQALDKYWHQQCDRPTICLMPLGIKALFSGAHDLINHPDEFVQVLFCTVSRGFRVGFLFVLGQV